MSQKLEDFVRSNRNEFDSSEIPSALWDRIERQILPSKKSPVINMGWVKMAAAAVVIGITGLLIFKLTDKNGTERGTIAKIVSSNTGKDTQDIEKPLIANQDSGVNTEDQSGFANNDNKETEEQYSTGRDEEIFHFTKLIQIKQQQLLSIKNDSPELYDHFVSDYKKLDASYHELREEIKNNPNKEVLLEKMIANLQLQIELLNQQLKVVRQLNKIKKDKANEISKTI
ncbi:MAG TPA: hypothetical protein VFN30_13300 [Chitinophagaceae bacterium]|nr:hypothetical protein [Chitinophagaceae bacterium]